MNNIFLYGVSYWSQTVVLFSDTESVSLLRYDNTCHWKNLQTATTPDKAAHDYNFKIRRFCFIGVLLHLKLSELVCVLWKQGTINSVTQSIIFEVPGTFRQRAHNRLRLSIFGNSTPKFNLGNVIKMPHESVYVQVYLPEGLVLFQDCFAKKVSKFEMIMKHFLYNSGLIKAQVRSATGSLIFQILNMPLDSRYQCLHTSRSHYSFGSINIMFHSLSQKNLNLINELEWDSLHIA